MGDAAWCLCSDGKVPAVSRAFRAIPKPKGAIESHRLAGPCIEQIAGNEVAMDGLGLGS